MSYGRAAEGYGYFATPSLGKENSGGSSALLSVPTVSLPEGFYAEAQKVNGIQIGLVTSARTLHCLQVGLYNRAERGLGLQVGVLTCAASGLAGCLPLLNFVY